MRSVDPAISVAIAPWYGPCRIVAPVVEQRSRDLAGRLKVVKVNSDEAPRLGHRFGVRGIPTLLIVDRGREVGRVVGAQGAPPCGGWVEAHLRSTRPAA